MIMAISIAGALALAGCNRAPQENPPPIPPDCPDLPELKNITLKDGSIRNVRIVQFRATKLYVPANLMKSSFFDENTIDHKLLKNNRFYIPKGLLRFIPDIHENECPGVIHHIRSDEYAVTNGFALLGLNGDGFGNNISHKSSIVTLHFELTKNGEFRDNYGYPYFDYETADVGIFKDVYSSYNTSDRKKYRSIIDSPEWIIYRESVRKFAYWLATPPRDRDNGRVFVLGVAK